MLCFETRRRALGILVTTLGLGCHAAEAPAPLAAPAATASVATSNPAPNPPPAATRPRVIVFVWDGLRPDSIDPSVTPQLARLRDRLGVNFTAHHAAFPTFTMMNAAALATGGYAAAHGFYGNTEYQPGASGSYSGGQAIDFSQPVFTEDYGVLRALDAFNRARGERLLAGETLFAAAQRAGLTTAVVGKTGPAYLQDFGEGGAILDENLALPLSLAEALQRAGLPLPKNTTNYPYSGGKAPTLAGDNGDPTAMTHERLVWMNEEHAVDPRATSGSPHSARDAYLMRAYTQVILPELEPDLSLIWLRNPDTTQHQFGPGTANHRHALADQDARLGELIAKLEQLKWLESTDLLIVSDHGHNTVAGDTALFPLRELSGTPDGKARLGAPSTSGYAASGEVRSADLLARAGFRHVYDGNGCAFSPVLSGVLPDGKLVYPTRIDTTTKICGKPAAGRGPKSYTTTDFRVPTPLPGDALVIAANGGSEYFYLVDHSPKLLQRVVTALQERSVYGAIFVHSRYGAVAGTLPLTSILAEDTRKGPPTPDLIVGFSWNATASVGGHPNSPGTEYASMQRTRGMHGSFSPIDVHNTLIAVGPHFKAGYADAFPSSNVDVAPTVARILGVPFDAPHGRVLDEALRGAEPQHTVTREVATSTPARLRRVCAPHDPPCARPSGAATYQFTLEKRVLRLDGQSKTYTYFDQAEATRHQPP